MKKILVYSLINLGFFTCAANAQWLLDSALHSQVTSGVDYIYKQEYNKADSLFHDLLSRYPWHPAGYLYQVGVMQAYATDFDVPVESKKFDSLLERGRNAALRLESPWKEYFLGTADGYEAYDRVERGEWFGGVRKGMKSASKFEEVVEIDSSFYDAYVGIGTYYYWSSRKTAFIRWLPFVKDNRQTGITLLIASAEHAEYNRFAAISALISIYLDAEDYKQAEEWSHLGLKSYPENRTFLWGFATALDRSKHYSEAVAAYTHLLENILQVSSPHPYNEIVCRLNLIKSKLAIGDTTAVTDNLHLLLAHEKSLFPPDLQSRSQAKFEEARRILTDIMNRRSVSK